MPPPGPYRILSFYLLIYIKLAHIKFAHSPDDIPGSSTLPSYESLFPGCISFSIQGNTAYHFEYFMKIYRFEDKWILIYSGKGEQISVNVSSRHSSTTHDCSSNDKLYTYTAKENVLFNMVIIGPIQETAEVIWALTGDTDYANKVVYDETDPNNEIVIIYHVNGLAKMFIKSSGEWEERISKASTDALTQDKVKIQIEGQSDEPGVIIDSDDNYLRYTFFNGTKCLNVEYDREQLLRSFNTHSNDPYPESVLFSFQLSTAIINFKDSMDILTLYNKRWILIYSGKGEQISVNVSSRDSSTTHDCVTKDKVYTYAAKDNKVFNEVRNQVGNGKEEIIFKTTDILEMTTVVKYDETDPNNLVLKILQLNGMIRTFKKSYCGTWNESISKCSGRELTAFGAGVRPITHSALFKAPELQLDLSKIRIFAQDSHDSNNVVECDVTMYTLEIIETVMVTYEFKEQVNCVGVRYDGNEVWKYDSTGPNVYPKRVHFLLIGPVVVEMSDDLFYFSVRKSNGNFESIPMGKFVFDMDDVNIMAVDSKLESVLLSANNFHSIQHKIFLEYRLPYGTKCNALKIKNEVQWLYDDSICPEYPSSLYVFADRIVVLCDDKSFIQRFNPNSPDQHHMPYEIMMPALAKFKFEKRSGYLFYEIDPRVKCKGIKYDGKEVWKPNGPNVYGPYPDHVAFFTRGNTVAVIFGDQWDILRLGKSGWETVFSGRPRPINLSIGESYSNKFLDYEKTDRVHTFTAKDNHLFGAVKISNRILGSETMVWKTERAAQWASKVVYDKTDEKNEVRIHGIDGMIKTFKKIKNGSWAETEVKGCDSELLSEKVEILVEGQYSENEELETSPALETNSTNPDSKDTDSEMLEDKVTLLEGDEMSIVFVSYGMLPSGRTRVDLDIRIRKSTEQFDYSQSYGFWTYEAKDGHYFASVKDGDTIIYKRSIAGSALKVLAEVDSSSTLVGLKLHLVSKEIRRFKYSNGTLQELQNKGPSGAHPGSERVTIDSSPGTSQKQIVGTPRLRPQECVS